MRSAHVVRPLLHLLRTAVVWGLASCSPTEDDPEIRVRNEGLERRMLPVLWDSISTICLTGPRDSIGMVIGLRADSGGVWLNDASNHTIVRLTRSNVSGQVVGRRGGGPGEFQGVRDMEFGTAGRLAVLDPSNARITHISAAGEIVAQISLPAGVGHAEQFSPLPDGGFLLVTMRPDSPLVRLDSSGRVVSRGSWPWSRMARLQTLAAQGHTAVSRDLEHSVYGMTFGEVFFVLVGGMPSPGPDSYVEEIEAPSITPRVINGDTTYMMPLMPMAGADLAIEGDRLLVLFGGRTQDRQRLVDAYTIPGGKYLYSFLLPRRISRFAVFENAIHTLYAEPHTCIQSLRPRAPLDTILGPRKRP